MVVFLPDHDDMRRAQAIVGGYAESRLMIIAARSGNPRGAESHRFEGGALALRAPGMPGSAHFNRAYGFHDGLIDLVPGVIDWFSAGVGGVFELAPGQPISKTARLLIEAGYAQSGFHATTASAVGLPDASAPGVEISRVEDERELALFSDAYHAGWANTGRIPMGAWMTTPGWTLYLARFEGKPVGAAVLYVVGEDGYLADGAVDPAFRRHGVHRALLDRRCTDAADAGATRIYSRCEFLSASYRNQMRKGLALLSTEAIWESAGFGA